MAKILIVDDVKIMRMTLKKMFVNLGHEVVGEADSGYEAIQQYKKLKPDLVSMDVTMPGVEMIRDGIEAVRHIVKFDPNAKILMVTSHGEQEKVIRAMQSGASNYLLKPVTMEKLKAKVNEVLSDD